MTNDSSDARSPPPAGAVASRRQTYQYILAILPVTEAPLIAAVVWYSDHRWISLASGVFFPLFAATIFKLSERYQVDLEKLMMTVSGLNLGVFCWFSGPQAPGWLEGIIYLTVMMYLVPQTAWKIIYLVFSIAMVTASSLATGKSVPEVVGITLGLSAYAAILMRTLRVVIRQNQQIEELLLNIFPRSIADELKTKRSVRSVLHPSASVLFTDFKGFTAAAERLTASELVTELDACFSRFDAIIGRRGLEKLKTIGDSYMCAGGIPLANATHPVDCVLAALEIRQCMRSIQQERQASGLPTWELRIGAHTGPLVAGVIGEKRFAYDIWGDTVNTASRMESSGQPGEINISSEMHALVADWFGCERRGLVPAKGKGELEMYFVKRLLPGLSADPEGLVPNEEFARRYAALAAKGA